MRLLFIQRYKILRRLSRFFIMDSDSDDDMLYYSHKKISSLIQKTGDKNVAIKAYLENLNYQPIEDFTPGLEWFNVSEPLSFTKHLKGKIVVLDFFTYCCINCMHILPDLREIEKEFSVEEGLVVIGVHSAKFENEKSSANILAAVQRYNIGHPVVNDKNSQMWRNCDVHCWPTLLIVGPIANPIVTLMGEGHKQNLSFYIRASLDFYKTKNLISNHKLPFKSAFHLLPDLKGPLLFPGKITNTRDKTGREVLAVSDTGNNRVLLLETNGTILYQIGTGRVGFRDGSLASCEFSAPQGLVFLDGSTIFVADTENHAIRKIDIVNNKVETVAGNGAQGHDFVGGKVGRNQHLSSPWDVCIYRTPDMDMTFYPDGKPPIRNVLIIAMAGTHQIWALFLEDTVWWKCKKFLAGTCICIAGSGKEENRNNAYPHTAGFAQPSGLALSEKNKEVYIADSESSSVRRLSLVDGKVTPVVGGDRDPNNLFAFGDNDGVLCDAKLQHSLGLAMLADGDYLLVADTYNHKLKKVNISQNSVSSIPTPEATTLSEPAGLCVSLDGKTIYVADTNNHQIKVIKTTPELAPKSISSLTLILTEAISETDSSKHRVFQSDTLTLHKKGGKLIFEVKLDFVEGLKLTEDAPQKWVAKVPFATWAAVPSSGDDMRGVDVVVSVPSGANGNLDFVFDLVTCTVDTCLPIIFVVRVPVKLGDEGATSVHSKVRVGLGPNKIELL